MVESDGGLYILLYCEYHWTSLSPREETRSESARAYFGVWHTVLNSSLFFFLDTVIMWTNP